MLKLTIKLFITHTKPVKKNLAKPKTEAPDFITMINFFFFGVDFPELLSRLCFAKRGLPFVFAPKTTHHRLPEILR